MQADIPAMAIIATQNDEFRKPGTGMWGFLCDHLSPDAKPGAHLS